MKRGWSSLGVRAGRVCGMGTGGSAVREVREAKLVRGCGRLSSPILGMGQ